MPQSYKCRPYQDRAFQAAMVAIRRGVGGTIAIPTGGGKTVVAARVVEAMAEHPGVVLWVSKDWRLLEQASDTIARVAPTARQGRLGGGSQELSAVAKADRHSQVVFTTLNTFHARGGVGRGVRQPTLVVWDECHWADGARMGKRLQAFAKRVGAPLLGLTATPRSYSTSKVLHVTTFLKLQKAGWLATPKLVEPVRTNVTWAPNLPRNRDFTSGSLRELGRNKRRNQCIVDYYMNNRSALKQTILFACDIEHANTLAQGLVDAGAKAGVIHNDMSREELANEVSAFKDGSLDVLVNVTMLTHGFDHPQTQTVMMARPTASATLYAQMIGRGSRIADGKTHFNIVDFTDNVMGHHDSVITAKGFFNEGGEAARPSSVASRRAASARRQDFRRDGRLRGVPSAAQEIAALRGLSYRENQTFGIELELTADDFDGDRRSPKWMTRANALLRALTVALGESRVMQTATPVYHSSSRDFSQWAVEYDGSCGWEVVSPKLSNIDGLRELVLACEALAEVAPGLGLRVNASTGVHLHLCWTRGFRALQDVIKMTHELEPMLASLVAPSRVASFDGESYDTEQPNEYARPVLSHPLVQRLIAAGSANDFDAAFCGMMAEVDQTRYSTLNVTPKDTLSTVEVRMHSGTLDAEKVLLWVSLWMQLLHACENGNFEFRASRYRSTTAIRPSGCLLRALLDRTPIQNPEFLSRLGARRTEVAKLWIRTPELRRWTESAADWLCASNTDSEWYLAAE